MRNWPLYGQNSGFVSLGTTMIILGISILGNLNKEATSQKSLGLAFWRIVIGAGIVVVVIGTVNIFAVCLASRRSSPALTNVSVELHLP